MAAGPRLLLFRCFRATTVIRTNNRIKIYTKTGDKGKSSNFAGQRLPKDNVIFEALGNNDELSSAIGLAREYCIESTQNIADILQQVQCSLQDVGSHIATPRTTATPTKLALTPFKQSEVDKLEAWIDQLDESLPPLETFILPSGGKCSAHLHLARTVCRRAERRIVPLYRDNLIDASVAMYINRLSDFLFTAARYVAHREGQKEVIYSRNNN